MPLENLNKSKASASRTNYWLEELHLDAGNLYDLA